MKLDLEQIVADKILLALNENKVPWQKPWINDSPTNVLTGKKYRGVNILLLGMTDYSDPRWGTFNQISQKGGHIKKGEKGTLTVFKSPIVKNKGTEEETAYWYLRYDNLFNVDQATWDKPLPALEKFTHNSIKDAEKMCDKMPNVPAIYTKGNKAVYLIEKDEINLPPMSNFNSIYEYYLTKMHELIHSTGHKDRLNRKFGTTFGSPDYAYEELTAEIGAIILAQTLGLDISSAFNNSVAYIDSWRKTISQDKNLILKASSHAQKAVDYIMGVKFENN